MIEIEWVEIPAGTFVSGLTPEQKEAIRVQLWDEFQLNALSVHQQDLIKGLIPKYRRRAHERRTYNILKDVTAEEKALMLHFTHNGLALGDYFSVEDNLEMIPDAREVWLPEFQISKYPVTVAQAQEFLKRTQSPYFPPNPVTLETPQQSSFETSQQLADWLNGRMPTPEQWEKAARGIDARRYPWGNAWDTSRGNFQGITPMQDPDGFVTPYSRVNRYPTGASAFGIWDMCGNASEWTASSMDDIQMRGFGFKEMNAPVWYWGMTTTRLPGVSSLRGGLRLVKQ